MNQIKIVPFKVPIVITKERKVVEFISVDIPVEIDEFGDEIMTEEGSKIINDIYKNMVIIDS